MPEIRRRSLRRLGPTLFAALSAGLIAWRGWQRASRRRRRASAFARAGTSPWPAVPRAKDAPLRIEASRAGEAGALEPAGEADLPEAPASADEADESG